MMQARQRAWMASVLLVVLWGCGGQNCNGDTSAGVVRSVVERFESEEAYNQFQAGLQAVADDMAQYSNVCDMEFLVDSPSLFTLVETDGYAFLNRGLYSFATDLSTLALRSNLDAPPSSAELRVHGTTLVLREDMKFHLFEVGPNGALTHRNSIYFKTSEFAPVPQPHIARVPQPHIARVPQPHIVRVTPDELVFAFEYPLIVEAALGSPAGWQALPSYRTDRNAEWRPLMAATDIYRPVQSFSPEEVGPSYRPLLMGIVRCQREGMSCRAEAMVVPSSSAFPFMFDEGSLWTWRSSSVRRLREQVSENSPSGVLYRFALDGHHPPAALRVWGSPVGPIEAPNGPDGQRYVMVNLPSAQRGEQWGLLELPAMRFGDEVGIVEREAYRILESPQNEPGPDVSSQLRSAFDGQRLVYGLTDINNNSHVYVYSDVTQRQSRPAHLQLPQRITQLITVRDTAFVFGIAKDSTGDRSGGSGQHGGLVVSAITLGGVPRIGATARVDGGRLLRGVGHSYDGRIVLGVALAAPTQDRFTVETSVTFLRFDPETGDFSALGSVANANPNYGYDGPQTRFIEGGALVCHPHEVIRVAFRDDTVNEVARMTFPTAHVPPVPPSDAPDPTAPPSDAPAPSPVIFVDP